MSQEIIVKCSVCGKDFELSSENFYRNKSKKSGFTSECKKCNGEITKIYQKNNKEKLKEKRIKYNKKNKDKILKRKRTKIKLKNGEKI